MKSAQSALADDAGELLAAHLRAARRALRRSILRRNEINLRANLDSLKDSGLLAGFMGASLLGREPPPLSLAASLDWPKGMAILMEFGADLSARSHWGRSALMTACEAGAPNSIRFIAAQPSGEAHWLETEGAGLSPFHYLAGGRHARLAREFGTPERARLRDDRGLTPLMAAIDPEKITGQRSRNPLAETLEVLAPLSDLWARGEHRQMTPLALLASESFRWSESLGFLLGAMVEGENTPPRASDADRGFWRENLLLDCCSIFFSAQANSICDGLASLLLAHGADPLRSALPSKDLGVPPGSPPRWMRPWDEAAQRGRSVILLSMAQSLVAQKGLDSPEIQALFREAIQTCLEQRSWSAAETLASFCELSAEELAEGMRAWSAHKGAAPAGGQMQKWKARWEAAEIAASVNDSQTAQSACGDARQAGAASRNRGRGRSL